MRIESTVHFPADHPAFAGHFPGTPVVPGVLLLDAVLLAWQGHRAPHATGPCAVSAAKFLSPVGPGETVTIALEPGDGGRARFDVTCDGRKVATGSLAPGADA